MYRLSPHLHLVLASASPRRRRMLSRLGLDFTLAPSQVDEGLRPGEAAEQAVQRLAALKAAAAAADRPGAVILAADTLVTLEGRILGKPRDRDQAREMLRSLCGREHQVVTGFCLRHHQGQDQGLARSRVRLRRLGREEMEAYLDSGESLDKAGAYAVQGLGQALVESVSGSYTNVVGLPLSLVVATMLQRGIIQPLRRATP